MVPFARHVRCSFPLFDLLCRSIPKFYSRVQKIGVGNLLSIFRRVRMRFIIFRTQVCDSTPLLTGLLASVTSYNFFF